MGYDDILVNGKHLFFGQPKKKQTLGSTIRFFFTYALLKTNKNAGSQKTFESMMNPKLGNMSSYSFHMCHGQGCRVFLGMGDLPPLMTESL